MQKSQFYLTSTNGSPVLPMAFPECHWNENIWNLAWQQGIGNLKVLPLHAFESQSTALVYWPENEIFQPHIHPGGEEILVLKGEFCDEYGKYPKHSWIRNPHLSKHHPFVEKETLILVKVGHLPFLAEVDEY